MRATLRLCAIQFTTGFPAFRNSGFGTPDLTTVTDKDGRFRMPGVPVGVTLAPQFAKPGGEFISLKSFIPVSVAEAGEVEIPDQHYDPDYRPRYVER